MSSDDGVKGNEAGAFLLRSLVFGVVVVWLRLWLVDVMMCALDSQIEVTTPPSLGEPGEGLVRALAGLFPSQGSLPFFAQSTRSCAFPQLSSAKSSVSSGLGQVEVESFGLIPSGSTSEEPTPPRRWVERAKVLHTNPSGSFTTAHAFPSELQ
ncbi:hypothetical protein FDECE_6812 [Fusarium decemcellulare]|nr:hypothetical protein FDECE_6812 [Fusarium decemcellulare]